MNTKTKTSILFTAIALDHATRKLRTTVRSLKTRKGFGINEVIGIAAGVIIAALVVIPGLQLFAGDVLDRLGLWWGEMADGLFVA
jgi:hypothetical protein